MTETAQALRERVAAGDADVTATELASAEAQERLGALRSSAAEKRAARKREREQAAQLVTDRAIVQAEWQAAHVPGVDEHVQALRAAAVQAAAAYIEAVQGRADELQRLAERAQTLGLRAEPPRHRSPLPDLGNAILDEVRGVLPWQFVTPSDSVWSR